MMIRAHTRDVADWFYHCAVSIEAACTRLSRQQFLDAILEQQRLYRASGEDQEEPGGHYWGPFSRHHDGLD